MKEKGFDKLTEEIEKIIFKYNDDNIIFNKLKEKVEYKINLEILTKIWNGSQMNGILKNESLYFFIQAMYDITKNEDYNPTNFFYDAEIDEFNRMTIHTEIDTTHWILHNVTQIDDHTYLAVDSIANITKGVDNNFLGYYTKTQRKPKIAKTPNGNVIELPDIRPAATREISDLFEKGKHPVNQVTYNVRQLDGSELRFLKYHQSDRTLVIQQDAKLYIDIIDGAHRTQGAVIATHNMKYDKVKAKYLDRPLAILITHFDVPQALDYVKQTAKARAIDEEFLKTINEKDIGLDMARQINTKEPSQSNSLFDKIASYEDEVYKMHSKYCYIRTISEAINYNFSNVVNSNNYRDLRLVNDHIVKVINEILGYYYDKITGSIEDCRKQNMILMDKAFIGYIAIAKATYNIPGWEDILDGILERLDVSWNNKVWTKQLKLKSSALVDARFVKLISEYFVRLVENEMQKEGVI